MGVSLAERVAQRLRRLPREERPAEVARIVQELGPGGERMLSGWRFWARPEQLAPADDLDFWRWWAVLTGRGWGKTRTAAEWVIDRSLAFHEAGAKHRVGLIGSTAADVRDVMVEGETGIEACCEARGIRCVYQPSKRRVTLPDLGTVMIAYSAIEPNRLRGPQHHTVWGDELAAWRLVVDREGNTAWTNADLGLRLICPPGMRPQGVVTTTPKPIPAVKQLVADGQAGRGVHLTRGTLYDNARNLAADYVASMRARYEGTRLGAQELDGVLLDAVEGALWFPEAIHADRVELVQDEDGGAGEGLDVALLDPDTLMTNLDVGYTVVGVDPPAETAAECGIIVVGQEAHPDDPFNRDAFVLDDATRRGSPEEWGRRVVDTYHKWDADAVVAEVNNGGDMVRAVIHAVDASVNVVKVRASSGKQTRAEPVATLYERHRVHHVGTFGDLESQMCTWVPGDPTSPDRMDALVWAVTQLLPQMTAVPAAKMDAGAFTGARGGSYTG